MTYVHCGAKAFDINKFNPIKNRNWNKPIGGLWASPVETSLGWESWCEREQFAEYSNENRFYFRLSNESAILHITSVAIADSLPRNGKTDRVVNRDILPDFEKIIQNGYDAIEIHISKDGGLYWKLYGWDCDSILVLNPNAIIETDCNGNDLKGDLS